MAMLELIEVLAESTKSLEDATQQAIADASKAVRNVKSIYIEHFEAPSIIARLRPIASTRRFHSFSSESRKF